MSGSDQERVYKSGRGIRQQHFPVRKTSVKSSWRRDSAGRNPQQSTLTQLDFCTPSSSVVQETDSEDDYQERRPRKKRRRLQPNSRQTTLTQMLPSHDDIEDSDFGLDGIRSPKHDPRVIQETQWDLEDGRLSLVEPSRTPEPDIILDSPIAGKSTTPQAHSPTVLSTPTRSHHDEIPSSHTPKSVLFTNPSRHRQDLLYRSPIKDRRTIHPVSPTSRSPDAASSHDHYEQPSKPIPPIQFRKPALPSPRKGSKIATEAALKRSMTVPDSQFDELYDVLTDEDAETSPRVPATCFPEASRSQLHSSVEGLSQYLKHYDPACSALDRDALRFMCTQLSPDRPLSQRENSPEPTSPSRLSRHTASRQSQHETNRTATLLRPATETIDLTSDTADLPSPEIGSPASSLPTPAKLQPRSSPIPFPIDPKPPPRASQATTVGGTQSQLWPSRIPQTRFAPSHDTLSSPSHNGNMTTSSPFPQIPSSPLLGSPPRHHSPFTAHTYSSPPEIQDSDDDDEDVTLLPLEEDENEAGQRRGWRLKLATEVLPDSLLEFTVPEAPVWSSSPLPQRREREEERVAEQLEKKQNVVGAGTETDYSLPPPSSGWRSSARGGR